MDRFIFNHANVAQTVIVENVNGHALYQQSGVITCFDGAGDGVF